MFNNAREIVVATYDQYSKPKGQIKTYLNSLNIPVKYSFIGNDSKEMIQFQGGELNFVQGMKI